MKAASITGPYNGEEEEPDGLPGLFPNLLANGASGSRSAWRRHSAQNARADRAATHRATMCVAATSESRGGTRFPTGGVIVDSADTIAASYATAAAPSGFARAGRSKIWDAARGAW